jgi:hypothetical protein
VIADTLTGLEVNDCDLLTRVPVMVESKEKVQGQMWIPLVCTCGFPLACVVPQSVPSLPHNRTVG